MHRATEAAAADTNTVDSPCPFCLTMMRDSLGHIGKGEQVAAQDVAEILAQEL